MSETNQQSPVSAGLAVVRRRIAAAAEAAGRDPEAVALIAVSKQQAADRVVAALEAGHRLYGENRVQEAAAKWPALRDRFPDVRVHLVGALQTNKARDAVTLFDAIHSVDRDRLARALADAMDREGRRPDCFVQVNIGEEPQKSGVAPADTDALVRACRETYGLPVAGLMAIPPADRDAAPYFALLAEIAARNGLAGLSMGMSGDYETAIRFGSTHVRVGTAIFGARPGGH